jgi:hypothetical protein
LAIGALGIKESQPDLFQVVGTLSPRSRFANFLNCGEQQTDQYRNNCDHNKQLNKSECFALRESFHFHSHGT